MRDFRHAKAMASTLRAALKERGFDLTHSQALELVARQFGLENWNVLAAKIGTAGPAPEAISAPGSAASAELPVLPVRDIVMFPGATLPLFVGRERSKAACEAALGRDRRIVVVTQRRPEPEAADDLHEIGVVALIQQRLDLPDGSIKLMVQGLERVTITRLRPDEQLTWAQTAPAARVAASQEAGELVRTVLERFQAYTNIVPMRLPLVAAALTSRDAAADGPGAIADALALHLALPLDVHQQFLELSDGAVRLKRLLELMQPGQEAA
jgi:ATP-dependent Lon protease